MKRICAGLLQAYPERKSALSYRSPFELLVAVVLSAQTTDRAVNQITPALFVRAPTPRALAKVPLAELEELLKTLGLFRNKARFLRQLAEQLLERFEGKVPQTLAELQSLAGVGRKTAEVVLNVAFGQPTIPVDTHVARVARRLGFSSHTTPAKIGDDLLRLLPVSNRIRWHHVIIAHGRADVSCALAAMSRLLCGGRLPGLAGWREILVLRAQSQQKRAAVFSTS